METLGPELWRFAVLNDLVFNQVEVVIEQKNGRLCITHGWHELNKLYDLKWGAVVIIISVQPSRFVMHVRNRYGEEIKYPVHTPPLFLKLNRAIFPEGMGSEFVIKKAHIPYRHDIVNFKFRAAKFLSVDDVASGVLVCVLLF